MRYSFLWKSDPEAGVFTNNLPEDVLQEHARENIGAKWCDFSWPENFGCFKKHKTVF